MAIIALPSQFEGKFRVGSTLNGNIFYVEDAKTQSAHPYSNGTPLRLRVAYGVGFAEIEVFDLDLAAGGWYGNTGAYGTGLYRITLQGDSDTDEYLVGYFPFQDLINQCRSGFNIAYSKHFEIDVPGDTVKTYWSYFANDTELVDPRFSIDSKQTWSIGDSSEYPYPLSKTYSFAAIHETKSIFMRIGGSQRIIPFGATYNGAIISYTTAELNVTQRFRFYKESEYHVPFRININKVGNPVCELRFLIYGDNGSNEPDNGDLKGWIAVHSSDIGSTAGDYIERTIVTLSKINTDEPCYLRVIYANITTHNGSNYFQFQINDNGSEYVDGGVLTDQGIGYTQRATDNLIGQITNNYELPVHTCEYGPVVIGEAKEEDCPPDIDSNLLYHNCTRFVLTDGLVPIEIREPIGWDSVEIIYKRDEKYLGVLTSYTGGEQELQFGNRVISTFECSKKYLDDQFDLDGPDAYVEMKFQILIDSVWYNLFKGVCDYGEYDKQPDFTSLAVRRISFDDQFKNLMDTEVDVFSLEDLRGNPVSVVPWYQVVLHSRHVRKTFYTEQTEVADNHGTYTSTGAVQFFNYVPNNIILDNIKTRYNYSVGFIATSQPELFELEMCGPMRVDCHIEFIVNKATSDKLLLFCFAESYEVETWGSPWVDIPIDYQTTITAVGGGYYKWEFDINKDITPINWLDNELALARCYKGSLFYFAFLAADNGTEIILDERCEGYLRIYQDTLDYNTLNKLVYAEDLMQSVAERISTANVVTNYLSKSTEKGKIMLCSGLELKDIRENWFVSFRQVIDSLQMMFDVGMGIRKTCPGATEDVFVEDRLYFFQTTPIIQIDECEEFSQKTATEFLWNEMAFGYSQYQQDSETEDNALIGYCSEQDRITPIKYYKNKLDLICDFIADHYMIEDFRRARHEAQEDKKSQNQDRDLFAVNVDSYTSKVFDYKGGYRIRHTPTEDTRVILFGEILNFVGVGMTLQIEGTTTVSFVITTLEFDYERNITFIGGYTGSAFIFNTFTVTWYVSTRMAVRNEEFDVSNDLVQPSSIYNARYTPLEILLNNQYRIVVPLSHKPDTEGFTFVSGEQNFYSSINPTTRTNQKALDEFVSNEDIQDINNSVATHAQHPVWIDFVAEITFVEVLAIEKAHRGMGTGYDYGYISVKNPEDGAYVSGWLYEMAFLPGMNRAKFKLLKADDIYLSVYLLQEDAASKIDTEDAVNVITQET